CSLFTAPYTLATPIISTLSLLDALPIYQGEDQDDHHRRHQQRQRDVPEAPPPAGAVDRRGVVELGGDALQAGEQDQRVEAHVRPDRKSTRLNSIHVKISYAVLCLKKKMK